MPRYAVYFVPDPAGALFGFGSAVIGYDSQAGRDVPFLPGAPCDAEDWPALTEDPRRYGFHATLRAPFDPRPGVGAPEVTAAARALAQRITGFVVPALTVARMGRFAALVPAAPSPELMSLAAACVEAFEPLRGPLSEADRARRMAAPLTPVQLAHLDRWGYPYVLDQFLFHMSLTGRMPEPRVDAVRAALAARYAALDAPVPIDAIAILEQPSREARFRLIARLPLAPA